MPAINSIAVFCGARLGNNPAYEAAAHAMGSGLAAAGIRLIYGGGRVGMMGVLADAVLDGGGTVLGVIPDFLLKWEVAHPGVTDMVVTGSMHARKQHMAEQADAFVALPGGLGTLDETIEIITWRLLHLHDKPILLCNVDGSAAPLRAAIEAAIAQGFADEEARGAYEVIDGVPALLDRLRLLPAGSAGPAGRL
ncbi:MAG: TIGR00730 family Rossman fold protein [Acetobacteraceae bacterium]|nr:TIGR00730 family Rossman fold protein [Acetobacteraceae bacterium]